MYSVAKNTPIIFLNFSLSLHRVTHHPHSISYLRPPDHHYKLELLSMSNKSLPLFGFV